MTESYSKGIPNGQPLKNLSKTVLIMDEVDGMSGNEDRAGIAELITLIKNTRVPMICICNDRYNQKIRSLSNHCFDLRFHRPQLPQIRSAIMSVLFKENVKMPAPVVDQIIDGSGRDIRQVLNHLNFLAASGKGLNLDEAKKASTTAKKDETVNVFEAVRTLFSASEESQKMTIHEKTELFFSDYDLVPLFVQENYLNVEPAKAKSKIDHLELISRTADLLSLGDTIDRQIRSEQNWSLLTQKAMFSTVMPCDLMKGRMHGQIAFPSWFGRFSKQNKFRRLTQQLSMHTASTASASSATWAMDYAPALRQRTTAPLLRPTASTDGSVQNVVKAMDAYSLTLEDRDAILEITKWPDASDPVSEIPSKVKAALTKAYKKHEHKLPYATIVTVGESKKRRKRDDSSGEDEEAEEDVVEDIGELI